MTDSMLAAPLYQRIFAVLWQRIATGEYAPGQMMPTEDALTEEFGVSKATIRQAVGALVAQGLVERKQGRGTSVRPEAPTPHEEFVGSIDDLLTGTPRHPVSDVRIDTDARFPRSVQADFGGLERGVVIRNRRTMGENYFVYSVHYLPADLGIEWDAEELKTTTLVELLHAAGLTPTGGEQTMAAKMADVDVAEWLEVGLGAPTLFSKRVLQAGERTIDVLHAWYRGDLYQWRSRLAVDTDGTSVKFRTRDADDPYSYDLT